MQGRVLCRISLLFILIIAFSAYAPIDLVGVYDKADLVVDHLEEGERVSCQGYVYHKEIKNDKVIYYVRNASLTSKSGIFSKTSFIFKSELDDIPNNCKLNIDEGRVKHFSVATNDGEFDMRNYYNSLGLYCEITDASGLSYDAGFLTKHDIFYKLQKNISKIYEQYLPFEEAGFLSSVVVGQKGNLNNDLKLLFQQVGIAHILAVSGLHVSVVCMALYSFLRKRGIGFLGSAVMAGSVAVCYGLLTGGSISSGRAIAMFIIYLGAQVFGESYDMLTALAFVGDMLLLSQPLYIKNTSFIFSFSAVLGISIFVLPNISSYKEYRRQKGRLVKPEDSFTVSKPTFVSRMVEYLGESLVFSFSMFVALLPVVTQLFYETPVYGTILNLIVLPFMPLLLGMGLFAGLAGLLFLPVAKVTLFMCHWVIYYYEMISDFAHRLPFAQVIVGRRSMVAVIGYYLVLYIVTYMKMPKKGLVSLGGSLVSKAGEGTSISEKSRNALYIKKQLKRRFLLLLILAFIWLIPTKGDFEIDFLDVGQGDGIFIDSGDGCRYFIDGGSSSEKDLGKYTLQPFLKSKGVSSIDYWFISHMDLDHVSGVIELLEAGYNIDNIVLSAEIPDGEILRLIKELATLNGTEILYMKQGQQCGTKHLKFTCVYPFEGATSDDINALSLSLLMEYDREIDGSADYRAFFGGDIAGKQESAIADSGLVGHVDLLKVSHHGSRFSSDETFLTALSPETAIISCSKVNRYGHPADEAIERLKAAGTTIYYTMNSGRVRVKDSEVEVFIRDE